MYLHLFGFREHTQTFCSKDSSSNTSYGAKKLTSTACSALSTRGRPAGPSEWRRPRTSLSSTHCTAALTCGYDETHTLSVCRVCQCGANFDSIWRPLLLTIQDIYISSSPASKSTGTQAARRSRISRRRPWERDGLGDNSAATARYGYVAVRSKRTILVVVCCIAALLVAALVIYCMQSISISLAFCFILSLLSAFRWCCKVLLSLSLCFLELEIQPVTVKIKICAVSLKAGHSGCQIFLHHLTFVSTDNQQ